MLVERKLATLIRELIDDFTNSSDVTLSAVVGCLELVKCDLIEENIEATEPGEAANSAAEKAIRALYDHSGQKDRPITTDEINVVSSALS